MSPYQVLARRWRPQRFEDLIGQDVVVRTLSNTVESGQIGHAYLFAGLRGVGKTTVARLFAKALNCERGPTADPCGLCTSCEEITAGSSLDVLEIDAASNRGIDDVRELREVARLAPARDRHRVFILDEAHQLSKDAFGALLKILEEPPAHVVFILASTEKDKFPATILSRCQQIDFRPIPVDLIAGHLRKVAKAEGLVLTEAAAQQLARAAAGSVRDGLSLLDRVRAFGGGRVDEDTVGEVLGLPPTEVLVSLWEHLAAGNVEGALAAVRREERAGHDPVALYEQFLQLLSTLLLLASDSNGPMPFAEVYRTTLCRSAERIGTSLVLRLLALALEQRTLINEAADPGLAVIVALGRLALWPRLQRAEELLAGEAPHKTAGVVQPGAAETQEPAAGVDKGPRVTSAAMRLEAALHEAGAHSLAGRVHMAQAVEVEGDVLVLRFAATPRATVQSVREAAGQVEAAARRAGLATTVRIECAAADAAAATNAPDLRRRVEADERVQRVIEVFGGRIENVEEHE